MKNPKHSIIIPAYNTGNAIRKCIDSIIAQSYTDWELIIVDDGSKDDTPAIIDDYAQRDSRIHALHIPNGGVSNARNVGLEHAKGEYVMFVDSDDWIEPDYLQKVEARMGDDADVYIMGITLDYEDESGRVYYGEVTVPPIYRYIAAENLADEIGYLMKTLNMESSCLKSYRRMFLQDNNICFRKGMIIFEDYYFVLQTLMCSPSVCLIPFVGYHYRVALQYNPVARRGKRDLYPSVAALFESIDMLVDKLNLQGYSRETMLRIMASKIPVVLNQSLTSDNGRCQPFRQITNDPILNKDLADVLQYAGGRYRLCYRFMRLRLYYVAYLIYKYVR